jgi:DNA/RNA-binding domain of Phe-tRNA-synthetase-like protein
VHPVAKIVSTRVEVQDHPSLRPGIFVSRFREPLGALSAVGSATPAVALLRADAAAPFQRDEAVRQAVRGMLRTAAYKPTGRGKPASEYLVRAAEEGTLDTINAAVDACNAVSLHTGFPISVVDAELALPPWRIAIAGAGERYVFNRAGQEIDLEGLLCLFDAAGPCANAVRDAQRTKTHAGTRVTLSVVWGVAGHETRLERAVAWYRSLVEAAGAETESVPPTA